MNLLLVIVEDQENVEDFLSVLVDMDVAGLQVVESSTVMEILAREAPIFAGLRQLITRPKAQSKLILGLVDRDDALERLKKMLERIGLDLDKQGIGFAVSVSVSGWAGTIDTDGE